jgi:hypothetical protein
MRIENPVTIAFLALVLNVQNCIPSHGNNPFLNNKKVLLFRTVFKNWFIYSKRAGQIINISLWQLIGCMTVIV